MPDASVGASPVTVQMADKIFVEVDILTLFMKGLYDSVMGD